MEDAEASHEQDHLASLLYHYIAKIERNFGCFMHFKISKTPFLKRPYTLSAGFRESCLILGRICPSCRLDFTVPKGSMQAAEEGLYSLLHHNKYSHVYTVLYISFIKKTS